MTRAVHSLLIDARAGVGEELSMLRIALRPVEPADLPVFFEHEQDPEAVRMAAFTAEDPSDREAFDAHWQRVLSRPEITMRTILRDDQVAGHIAQFEREGDAEVTYWVGREHWGKGVATQALRLLLEEVATRPLFARAAADNVASVRVLQKCGFVEVDRDRGFANARQAEIEEIILRLD
jgi:RimJ/RimL family protein N-acetyltransferase